MKNRSFSISDSLSSGYYGLKHNFIFLISTTLISGIVFLLPSFFNYFLLLNSNTANNVAIQIQNNLSNRSNNIFIVLHLIFVIVLVLGYLSITLKIAKSDKARWDDLFSQDLTIFRFIVASTINAFATIFGLLLFIVPGVIWFIRFSFYPAFIVDQQMTPIAALRASVQLSNEHWWHLFAFYALMFTLNGIFLALNMIFSTCFFAIGLLFTIPISTIAYCKIYQKLGSVNP